MKDVVASNVVVGHVAGMTARRVEDSCDEVTDERFQATVAPLEE